MTGRTKSDVPLLVADEGPVRILTLNRPAERNAIDLATATAIDEAVTEFDADPVLRVAILAANGPAFCAGMDLKAFLRGERPSTVRGFAGLVEQPPAKPVIAAVEGAAVAGGFELVLACDLVVAAETAFFALPEVRRGLVAAGGGLLRLPGRMPYHLAMELALTGNRLAAADAGRQGLVNRLTPPGEALPAALELAREVGACGPLAVTATKKIIQDGPGWPRDEAFGRQRVLAEPVRSSADAAEGALAFTEKRAPVWTGK
ncbi:crotonase/enoyl-CoA hydratase family protein [Amycolatopsis acidicola]|uniref:Crotonase/enoyl-CoA hydratase family protein n=1 Tax=Amycolatopsis acidicola TaxID=2596893 RepID=A0A5N0VJB0_9PSEU|nr:crotonase/enoyl-CoA hydratase family protein [Amycolatopsis acidicola]KAA9166467.1 crotonase/enoyl-CoA hydratase family protein [Amycolatopsis acidicola]